VPLRLSAFGSDHGLPQERFYNLVCLAFGADRVGFADLANYLPSTRTPGCAFEYLRAFATEITAGFTASKRLDPKWQDSDSRSQWTSIRSRLTRLFMQLRT
jgi:Putative metallopeptidase